MGNSISKRGGDQASTTPTGLYDHCEWDPKVVRRLILERKLAPITIGKEEAVEEGLEECPICFLYYAGGLNRSRCCRKGACTECYLQVKKPNQSTTCPFCNHSQYIVAFSGPLSKEEVAQEAQEQMKVLELKISMRKEEIERDKQRELERERLRKEREQNPSTAATSNTIATPSPRQPPEPATIQPSQSVPSKPNPQTSPFGTYGQYYFGSSYPPTIEDNAQGDSTPPDPDLEELMLLEAIRLSLLEVNPAKGPEPLSTKDSSFSPNSQTTPSTATTTSTTRQGGRSLFGSSSDDDSHSSYNSDDDAPLTFKSTNSTHTTTTTTSTNNMDNANSELFPKEPLFGSADNFDLFNFNADNDETQITNQNTNNNNNNNNDNNDNADILNSFTDLNNIVKPNEPHNIDSYNSSTDNTTPHIEYNNTTTSNTDNIALTNNDIDTNNTLPQTPP